MQVTQTSSEGLKREFRIVVGRGDIERRVDEKLRELSRRVRVPGFRPGKVPVKLLKQQYGRSVMGEVLEETVNSATEQAIREHELRPALQPRIEVTKFGDEDDLEYTMAVEVMPDVVAGNFSEIKVEKLVAEVDDAQVDETVQRLAEQQKTFVTTPEPRAAADGDAVVIDFLGKVDGVAFDGGSAEDYQLVLGSGSFIPGFEEQLVGAMPGERREVNVRFPDEYGNRDLAGKAAVFEVTVKEVKEPVAVAIDDEMAKRMGLDDLAALREAVRQQMQKDYAGFTRSRLKRNLLDILADRYDFPVPQGMVDLEFEQIWKQLTQDSPLEELLASGGKTEDDLKAEYRRIAERRVRLGLLLSEVGRTNNIEVQADEVTRAMVEQARRFPGQERQVMEYFQKTPQAMAQLRAPLYEDKVVDFILEMADVSEKQVSREELLREPDEPAPPAA